MMRCLVSGDGIGPRHLSVLVSNQKEQLFLQLAEDRIYARQSKQQLLSNQIGRYRSSDSRETPYNEVAHQVMLPGPEAESCLHSCRDTAQLLFPLTAWY